MKSSTGAHFIGMDHLRALAAYLVVLWHFNHFTYPSPQNHNTGFFPLSLLSEGHTGVALFMTLSGYLFAKLLDGKSIRFAPFIWNRALRLLPLLALVVFLAGVVHVAQGESVREYLKTSVQGLIFPTLPNGGWSITVELHFYLLLPLLLWLFRQSRWLPLALIAGVIGFRAIWWIQNGEVQSVAYWTILGRIDQFVLGMMGFYHREKIAGRHGRVALILAGFMLVFWFFDLKGGFYRETAYTAFSLIWLVLPTLEGLAYGALIAWYDNSFSFRNTGFSKFLGRAGELSYSMYLLHAFIVYATPKLVHAYVMPLSNFYLIWFWATVFYLVMLLPAELSYRYIEAPFLRFRKRYTAEPNEQGELPGGRLLKPVSHVASPPAAAVIVSPDLNTR